MSNIRNLLNQIASAETQLHSAQFLAPCVQGGRVRTRVAGMIYTFVPNPRQFEGWGIFQPMDEQTTMLLEEADLPQIVAYLQNFQAVRFRLAYCLQGQTWLAYPVNEADMRQRFKVVKPVPIHLVVEGIAFEQIIARSNGQSYWFEEVDRRADPAIAETLLSASKASVKELHFKGITPEMRTVYELVAQRHEVTQPFDRVQGTPQQDEKRLRKALHIGGGELDRFQDRGDYWTVEWTTKDGTRHTSAIVKTDLTVVSSGICLSGRDRDFDLQSLVGVIERQEY